jgi:outer membrane protein TolC
MNGASTNAVDEKHQDYERHLEVLKKAVHSQPSPAATGADGQQEPSVLVPDASASGPSKAGNATVDDSIEIGHPTLKSLIQFNDYLDPFKLDAAANSSITLRDALMTGLDRNLDLAISRTNSKQKQFAYYSALGNFLPDPTLGFSDYFVKGSIALPGNFLSAARAPNGAATSSGQTDIRLNHPFEVMHAGGQWYAYRGGSVLFGSLEARNNYRAAQHQEHASLSDTLMTITQNYYNLILAEALLKIRIDAVRTSEEQLHRNQDRFHSGLATHLDVLQSETQLSRDRQALVDQQANRRSAALTLADSLNLTLAMDLNPVDLSVREVRLIDPKLDITRLLRIAIDNRPELKQYEELRLAAKKAIMVSAANLQPTVALSGNEYGIGPSGNIHGLGVFAVNINWRLRGMGVVDSMDTAQARWQARQAALQATKELQTICSQVRNSYVQILDKERNVGETLNEVRSAREELRLAELRKSSGLGINLDIISAQRDYTQARVSRAQAMIEYNIAQAQLLHDLGMMSTDALTSGRLLSESK